MNNSQIKFEKLKKAVGKINDEATAFLSFKNVIESGKPVYGSASDLILIAENFPKLQFEVLHREDCSKVIKKKLSAIKRNNNPKDREYPKVSKLWEVAPDYYGSTPKHYVCFVDNQETLITDLSILDIISTHDYYSLKDDRRDIIKEALAAQFLFMTYNINFRVLPKTVSYRVKQKSVISTSEAAKTFEKQRKNDREYLSIPELGIYGESRKYKYDMEMQEKYASGAIFQKDEEFTTLPGYTVSSVKQGLKPVVVSFLNNANVAYEIKDYTRYDGYRLLLRSHLGEQVNIPVRREVKIINKGQILKVWSELQDTIFKVVEVLETVCEYYGLNRQTVIKDKFDFEGDYKQSLVSFIKQIYPAYQEALKNIEIEKTFCKKVYTLSGKYSADVSEVQEILELLKQLNLTQDLKKVLRKDKEAGCVTQEKIMLRRSVNGELVSTNFLKYLLDCAADVMRRDKRDLYSV